MGKREINRPQNHHYSLLINNSTFNHQPSKFIRHSENGEDFFAKEKLCETFGCFAFLFYLCIVITFEAGFRYFVYAESHKSKPNLMRKFREAMASYQSEQEQANVVIAQQKQRRLENLRSDFERRKIENTTRQSVQMEMSEKLISLTTKHDAKTKELETEL